MPIASTTTSTAVMDGRSLLETRPESNLQTIGEYAIHLLTNNVYDPFKKHVDHHSFPF